MPQDRKTSACHVGRFLTSLLMEGRVTTPEAWQASHGVHVVE